MIPGDGTTNPYNSHAAIQDAHLETPTQHHTVSVCAGTPKIWKNDTIVDGADNNVDDVQLESFNEEHCANQDDEVQDSQESPPLSLCSEEERWLDDADQMLQAELLHDDGNRENVAIGNGDGPENLDDDQNSEHLDMPDIEHIFGVEGNDSKGSSGNALYSVDASWIKRADQELQEFLWSPAGEGGQNFVEDRTIPICTGASGGERIVGGTGIEWPFEGDGDVENDHLEVNDEEASGSHTACDEVCDDAYINDFHDINENVETVTLMADVESLTMNDLNHFMRETSANVSQVEKILQDLASIDEYKIKNDEIKGKVDILRRVVNYRESVCTEKLVQLNELNDLIRGIEEMDEMISLLRKVIDAQDIIKKTCDDILQLLVLRNQEMAHFNELEKAFDKSTQQSELRQREAAHIKNALPKLLEYFKWQKYPSDESINQLAQETGVENRLIKKWFAMQRLKDWKREFNAAHPK